jgi:hypothetical protein
MMLEDSEVGRTRARFGIEGEMRGRRVVLFPVELGLDPDSDFLDR